MNPDRLPEPTSADKVRFLTAAVAPDGAATPVIETHMSWVFVGRDRVFKLKKPVHYPFLDFSTPDARAANCSAEVRLNRRLAPDVYLGVAPLLQQADGRLALGTPAEGVGGDAASADAARVIDWLVVMRRLPRECMLDTALAEHRVGPRDIDRLADTLVAFFRAAPVVALSGAAYVQRLRDVQAINREVLSLPRFAEPAGAAALDLVDTALRKHHGALAARADGGYVREGHGDLRPEHINLAPGAAPVIIDALEFNLVLRQVDPFDELAHLDLECRILGADWVGPQLLARCAQALGEAPPPVTATYLAYRAVVHARLALAHLLEPAVRTPRRWPALARRYIAVANAAAPAIDVDRTFP